MKILAFGSDGKGRFAFAKSGRIRLSSDFGSLQDVDNFERYEHAIRRIIKKEKPEILACDLHPGYNSTKLALSLRASRRLAKQSQFEIASPLTSSMSRTRNDNLQLIQHHHAHIASCMLDNKLKARVIGVAFDGTGFGSDGNIWGGEFFLASPKGFRRVAHLEYMPMPGGEMAVREPWRMAVSYLYKYYRSRFMDLKIPFLESLNRDKISILKKMMENKINSPQASSMGRLFDGVGALINLINSSGLEGEAALKLEDLARGAKDEDSYYNMKLRKEDKKILILTKDLIKGIVEDLERGVDKAKVAMKFHNSIARMIYDVSEKMSSIYNTKKVLFSGGVFQNKILLEKAEIIFRDSGVSLYTHRDIPATDAGISAGQAFIVSCKLNKGLMQKSKCKNQNYKSKCKNLKTHCFTTNLTF